jgi:hypothetical protein
MIGHLGITDIAIGLFGLGIRIAGDLVDIIGILLFKTSLDYLPDFSEFDWIPSIRAVIVVHSNGVPCFSRFWGSNKNSKDLSDNDKDSLISGAMSTVEILLNEMVGKELLNRIQLDDKVVLFEKRNNFMTIVIATEYLDSLSIRIRNFSDNFEEIFGSILKDWGGNITAFLPAEAMADIHFIPRTNLK